MVLAIAWWRVRYESWAGPKAALRIRRRDLVSSRVRDGYQRLNTLPCQEGQRIDYKQVSWIYGEEGLGRKGNHPKYRWACPEVETGVSGTGKGRLWSRDFMPDHLCDGRGSDQRWGKSACVSGLT